MDSAEFERLERERAYHNARFAAESRVGQDKYYFALQGCDRRVMALVERAAVGADVLEYGCGTGYLSVPLAGRARSLTGIDISEVAIELACDAAAAAGAGNTRFLTMNAEALELPDASFDLVFGSGILHHLDLPRALAEVARVLRPGGRAIFKEPLGHNALINAYRRLTPQARTEDEHPLTRADLALARRVFPRMRCEFHALATLASVPFRDSPLGGPVYAAAAALDAVLTRVPGVRLQAWYSLMVLQK
jgi:ubiquinone/menaquinone biosynthesis C-methylase UbiE